MTRTVTVTGVGSASAVPDMAVLRVAAVLRAGSVREAFDGVSSAVSALLAVAGERVPDDAVASRGLEVWTESDPQGRPSQFRCQHSVTVRCPSLDVASSLLGALVEEVGDRLEVHGVGLEVSDPSAAQAAAREAAYADAVARASALAALAGAELGEAQAVTEGRGPSGGGFDASMAKAAAMPFAAGEQSVGASVTVVFALT